MQQYAMTHQGRFPWNVHAGQTQGWMYTLMPFAENVDDIRMCPDDPNYVQRMADPSKESSYVINEYVSSAGVDGAILRLYKVHDTSKLIVLFEGSDNRGAQDDHVHASVWYTPLKIAQGLVWPGITNEINPSRHVVSALSQTARTPAARPTTCSPTATWKPSASSRCTAGYSETSLRAQTSPCPISRRGNAP